jgi:hypothetical protein
VTCYYQFSDVIQIEIPQALGGDGSNFTMNPQTGEFSVTKMLDYEAGQFYLFNMIVTV